MKWLIRLIVITVVSLPMFGCKPVVNTLAFHPDRVNVVQPERLPPGVKEIALRTEDGVSIQSLYLPMPGSARMLIYFHGNGGNIYHRLETLMKLRALGLNVLGVSYRGYGRSDGSPSEEGIYLDGRAAYGYAINKLGFAKSNIILFGRSIGTAVAINTAQHQPLASLILVSPLTSGKEQAEAMGLRFISGLAGSSFNNLQKIKNVQAPLLVIHGTDDQTIPFFMGEAIFNKAPGEKEFVKIEGARHNDLDRANGGEYWQVLSRYLTLDGG